MTGGNGRGQPHGGRSLACRVSGWIARIADMDADDWMDTFGVVSGWLLFLSSTVMLVSDALFLLTNAGWALDAFRVSTVAFFIMAFITALLACVHACIDGMHDEEKRMF